VADIQLIKMPGGLLRGANEPDAEVINAIKNGKRVRAKYAQPSNSLFHRKLFALLNFAFDYWQPDIEIHDKLGIVPEKNFDRFRADVLILSGFRKLVVNVKGEVRYEAESISFANMDDTRFHEVYKAVFGTCWRLVLKNVQGMTEQVAHNTINTLLSFD